MTDIVRRSAILLLLAPSTGVVRAQEQHPAYPPTPVRPVVETLHGVRVVDPYRWLEDGDDPQVQGWTQAQNRFAREYLSRFDPQRKQIRNRLQTLYAAPEFSAPRIHGDRYFTLRREAGQNQPVVVMREGAMDAEPRVVLNPNQFSEDGTVALDWWHPSPAGRLIAYGRSVGGDEMSTLHLRDTKSGIDTALVIPHTRACEIAWDADGQGFLYTRYPEPGSVPPGDELLMRYVRHHKFGTNIEDDPILYGLGRPKGEWPGVYNSSDDRYQFLYVSTDWTRNDLYVRPNKREAQFRPVAVGLDGEFHADVYENRLLILTTYEAPRRRLLLADVDHPERAWTELVPESSAVIQEFVIADGKVVVHALENVYSRLSIFDLDGQHVGDIQLPALGAVTDLEARPDRDKVYFRFESFTHAPTLFRYDLGTHERTVIQKTDIDIDPDQYETQQVWSTSADGTKVPMFVVARKGLERDGDNPALLYGYGGFGISLTPQFDRDVFPWLDRCGVVAVANLRGGGEFGREWHEAGRLEHKQNAFDDMIACAQTLIDGKYARPGRLAIAGRSNGGLLVAAVLTQRPDLFRAAYCGVPLTDMLRFHEFLLGPLWMTEYGSPESADGVHCLRAYSPYHNVQDGVAYPAVLITSAESDTRVDPAHARKFAARLQAATVSDRPVLLRVEKKAGHGAGKPLDKHIDEQVDALAFLMGQLGMLDDHQAQSD